MDVEVVLQKARTDRVVLGQKIQELEHEHDRLADIIAYLEASRSNGQPRSEKPYSGMVLAAATAKLLENRQRWLNTRDVVTALTSGGYESKAKDLYNNCFSTLQTESETEKPRVIKDGPKWGLPGWTSGVDPAGPKQNNST